MRLPEICIRRPVLAIVLNLLLIVVGVLGYQRLEIRYFPQLQFPIVTISTHYSGAGPDLIENSITTPIENALAGVSGIESISSTSYHSWSVLTITFKIGGNLDEEVASVRDKVSAVRPLLPVDSDDSVIRVGGHDRAAMSLGFVDSQKTSAEIRDYVARYVIPPLRELPGVGSISLYGASSYALRIWLDSQKMATLGVTVSDITTALQSNNIQFPGGAIEGPNRTFTVISDTRLKSPEQFADIVISKRNGNLVRFRDIARVELGSRSSQESPMRINGKPAVDVEIKPLKGANPISVSKAVRAELEKIQQSLPKGMSASINYDQSKFLQASINETFKAVAEAVFLVVIVVFLFLGSIRAASVPVITIPLCIIAVFGLIYFLGYSINVMTLLAIVLSIGLVVDDAIVMLENIHRYIEHGVPPLQAALKGSKEIAYAVMAMTITLAAVYAPIGFTQGYTATIFKEFAFTLAGVVIISGFVALTLSPMMCSKLLRSEAREAKLVIWLDRVFIRLSAAYRGLLEEVLRWRAWVVLIVLTLAIVGFGVFRILPSEFVPQEDTGLIVTSVTSPTGSTVQYTDKYMRQIEKLYAQLPEVKAYYSMIGSQGATSYLALKPWGERDKTTQQLVADLIPKLKQVPGVEAYPTIPDPIDYGAGGSDVTLQVMTASNYKVLQKPLEKLVQLAERYPGLEHVRSNIRFDDQQFAIKIHRDLAADLGVSIQDIADTMSAMLGGAHITDLEVDGRSYEVIVQMQHKDLENFSGIDKLYVKNIDGKMVPLSSLIELKPVIGQSNLRHYDRMRSAALTAQLAPGYSISQAVKYLERVAPSVMTSKTRYEFAGKAAQYLASAGSMAGIFILAFIFIYLVLSAQFGSFIDPFIILFAVPLCIVGALLALWVTGGSLNLYSQIGLVTLVGMIAKHGILITQFTNELVRQGKPMFQAIVAAASVRLRPILMTTSAMVIGTLPLAFASGPGSVGREQIGWVIVGGLLIGTFFSLFVVPVAYSYLGRFKERI